MKKEVKDNIVAIIGGETLMLFSCAGIINDVSAIAMKVFITIVLSVAGGVAGMVGKDLYSTFLKPVAYRGYIYIQSKIKKKSS
jgi:hypothetical protein